MVKLLWTVWLPTQMVPKWMVAYFALKQLLDAHINPMILASFSGNGNGGRNDKRICSKTTVPVTIYDNQAAHKVIKSSIYKSQVILDCKKALSPKNST